MLPRTLLITAALLLTGCSITMLSPSSPVSDTGAPREAGGEDADDELIEFNGIMRKKSELSEDTLKWLKWYQTLPEDSRDALSFIPGEFITSGGVAVETDADPSPSYLAALTEEDLLKTEELARYYFTEASVGFDGVEEIYPAEDSYYLYRNTGIEAEYDPGNIIIYMVLTGRDQAEGNPARSISIARRSKSDSWKVINSGH